MKISKVHECKCPSFTGMSELRTVKHAYDIITKYHNNVAVLHCVSSYPTAPKDVNLRVIDLFRSEFPETPIGYSSHDKGYHICIAAVSRGAKVSLNALP